MRKLLQLRIATSRELSSMLTSAYLQYFILRLEDGQKLALCSLSAQCLAGNINEQIPDIRKSPTKHLAKM